MKRYQNTVGPSMITKSMPHVEFIVKRAHHLARTEEGKEKIQSIIHKYV